MQSSYKNLPSNVLLLELENLPRTRRELRSVLKRAIWGASGGGELNTENERAIVAGIELEIRTMARTVGRGEKKVEAKVREVTAQRSKLV